MQRGWVASQNYRATIEAVQAARKELGLSQRELARRLNKPPSFINKIELLERRLDILEFVALARGMGLAPSDLLARIMSKLPGEFQL